MRPIIIHLILSRLYFHSLRAEWSKASEQLTNQDAETPYVRLVAITGPNQNFRSRIGGCATICPGFLILCTIFLHLLGESKIYFYEVVF